MRKTIYELIGYDDFRSRHIGINDQSQKRMLEVIGCDTIEDLIKQSVPDSIREDRRLNLGEPMLEQDALNELREIAKENVVRTSLIGMGYYGTITPPVVLRNVLENPAWYTSYTPYQPEISQGRLEALLNFQTVVSELTKLPVSNASLLDEATACAEAMTMAKRISKVNSNIFLVDANTHPQIISILKTRARPIGISIQIAELEKFRVSECFGALVSMPGSTGEIVDPETIRDLCANLHSVNAISVAATDLLACTLLLPPGELGFDISVGSAQRFGVPMGAGGPHAAFIATRESHSRALPGRIVGASTDTKGRTALRLALQTREQHIRRERATSNICTAQALLANIAGFYAVWHGPSGLVQIAERVNRLTSIAVAGLRAGGFEIPNTSWFDTVRVLVVDSEVIAQRGLAQGLLFRIVDRNTVAFSFDETTTIETVVKLWQTFEVQSEINHLDASCPLGIATNFRRTDDFLCQETFRKYKSEHEMLRVLRQLADKDLALDRTMIPLGSCTMKLNATSEMIPITWKEFANIHPFAPDADLSGYRRLVEQLSSMLLEITGYDAISLQPNAGSQGEFAGLMAIREYHRSRGDSKRVHCLIPSSAHGTNAASAVMAGMTVVVVSCDEQGNVDLEDLRSKCATSAEKLAALMITYPSTHGVFEQRIDEICEIVHSNGGQVYLDGANLNALVGVARPGKFGADVSHLNLHKTFCIPHGGGGPGVGPVAVKQHLANFLPSHPLAEVNSNEVGAVAASPFGSASILPISWVYIKLMGSNGLRHATFNAILSANYVAARLEKHFPILYRGETGFVAHECILDIREITKSTKVTNEDIAKRLMDYCFHAPTMSFPVAGTLMIEPTESETLKELDRFCDAMIGIANEIQQIRNGTIEYKHSALFFAPHTVEDLCNPWDRQYSQRSAVFPIESLRNRSYFVPVSRIDAAYGDTHLVCTCDPIENYVTALK